MYKCGNWMCENCIIQTLILLLLIISALFTYKLQIFKCCYFTSLILPFFLRLHFIWGNLGKMSSLFQILTPSPLDISKLPSFRDVFLLPDGTIFFIERLLVLFPLIVMIVSFNLFYFYTFNFEYNCFSFTPYKCKLPKNFQFILEKWQF